MCSCLNFAVAEAVGVLASQGSLKLPMASNVRRQSSNSLAALLARDFDEEDEEQEITDDGPVIAAAGADLSLSRGLAKTKRLIRTVSHSMSRRITKKNDIPAPAADETINGPDLSSGCLRLYGRGTGCKVGACEEFDFLGGGGGTSRAKSTAADADERLPHHRQTIMPRIEAMLLHRLSHGVSDMFRRRSFKKEKTLPESPPLRPSTPEQQQPQVRFALPDDVLEMCLVRLPLSVLMTARLVCRRWRALSTTPHFMQMRAQGSYRTPWLFLFGIVNNNGCQAAGGGEIIHALDVSMDRWHRITADFLQGRYLFSVATIGTHLYVVGGCSSLQHRCNYAPTTTGRNSSSLKTHKTVFVFSPLTGSWSKAASMKCSRSGAVLGVVDITSNYPAFNRRHSTHHHPARRVHRTRIGGVSDVYEDPHRCSVRRHQLRDAFSDSDDDDDDQTTRPSSSSSSVKLQKSHHDKRCYALIAVGGAASWDHPLDSAEIYDPATNRWIPIAKLPPDFGVASSGAVCNGVFYVYSDADKLAAYSLQSGTWTTIHVSPPQPPRLQEYFPKLVSCDGDQLFLITVSWSDRYYNTRWATQPQRRSTDKAIRKMRKLTSSSPASLSWTEVSTHPDAPMDFNADFVGQNNTIYGVEMFRIFGQLLSFITVCDVSESGYYRWSRISRNRSALAPDATPCKAKAMAVMQL